MESLVLLSVRICKRNISGINAPYTLDFIDVQSFGDLYENREQSVRKLQATFDENFDSIDENVETIDENADNLKSISPIVMEDAVSNAVAIRTTTMLLIEYNQPAEQEILQNNPQERQLNKIVRKTNNNIVNRSKEPKLKNLHGITC